MHKLQGVYMELIRKVLPRDHNLFLFGDDHEGNTLRHDEGWEQLVDMMHSEYAGCSNNFGVDHGDIVEAIPASDPRWYAKEEKSFYIDQIQQAVKNRQKIKDLLIAILDGNHPMKYWRFGNATQNICDQLGVRFGTWSCHITYLNKNNAPMYKQFATHGARIFRSSADDPIRQDSNKKLSVKRALKNKFADTVLNSVGHSHGLIICEPQQGLYLNASDKISQHYTKSKPTDDYIPDNLRWYVNTGSFLKLFALGFSGYAERAGYDPIELGFAIASIRDGLIQCIDKIVISSKH